MELKGSKVSGDEEEGETPTEGDREGVKQMGNKAKIEREEAEAEKMKTGHRQSKPPPPLATPRLLPPQFLRDHQATVWQHFRVGCLSESCLPTLIQHFLNFYHTPDGKVADCSFPHTLTI